MEEKIELDFGERFTARHFASAEELATWAHNEFDIWSKFAERMRRGTPAHSAASLQRGAAQSIAQFADQITTNRDPKRVADIVRQLVGRVQSVVSDQSTRFLPSHSPAGDFVLTSIDHPLGPDFAGAALAFFNGRPLEGPLDGQTIAGLVAAAQFDSGQVGNVDAERAALSALRDEWVKVFKENDAAHQKSLALVEQLKANLEKAAAADRSRSDQELVRSKGRLSELENQFLEKIRIDSSTAYWRSVARSAFISFAAWAVLAALLTTGFAITFYELAKTAATEAGDLSPQAIVLQYVSLLVMAVLAVGALRVIVRIMLSARHVEQEAQERVTMIQTYLALIKDDKKLSEEERHLILPTLFRPGSTGLIKDDPKGELPAETLMRMASRLRQ